MARLHRQQPPRAPPSHDSPAHDDDNDNDDMLFESSSLTAPRKMLALLLQIADTQVSGRLGLRVVVGWGLGLVRGQITLTAPPCMQVQILVEMDELGMTHMMKTGVCFNIGGSHFVILQRTIHEHLVST